MAYIADHDQEQIERANASGRTPVVFVHGLWLLPSSWDRWCARFEAAGYSTLAPGWPDDADAADDANTQPEVFARQTVGQVADHLDDIVEELTQTPAIVGHSLGGLLAQVLAGRGLSAATVAVGPAPFRGALPLPISSLRAASPGIGDPSEHGRAVPLTYEQFRHAFANAVSEQEAKDLYDTFAVPAAGVPLFEAPTAHLDPWPEVKIRSKAVDRGPLLIISGEHDHTVPRAITDASFEKQRRNVAVTEITEIRGRGHSLTIDSGWRAVADTALAFVQRFVAP